MERNYPEIVISNEGVTWLDKVKCGCIKII